ncbi:MAG: esterase [Oxalobacteraceae bacterium]
MRQTSFALALLAAAALAGCGGGGGGDQTPKVKFNSQVSFGDSLSDIGTYAVGGVKALGGGKYTVNDVGADGKNAAKNWTELMAAQFDLPAPCSAETGLLSNGLLASFAAAISFVPACTSYAQGGARVTEEVGPANMNYRDAHTSSQLGQLTVPVTTQISNHLAKAGGKFKGDEIVFVMAGGNDLLFQANQLQLDATAAGTATGTVTFAHALVGALAAGATDPITAAQAIGLAMATESARPGHTDQTVVGAAVGAAAIQPGNAAVANPAVYGPMVANAQAAAATAGATAGAAYASDPAKLALYVKAMADAGDQLSALVKNQIVANGAQYVTVLNLPDASQTPYGLAQSVAVQKWLASMVSAFNSHLEVGLAGQPKVLQVDAYWVDHDQASNPGPYGLTNVTTPACADVDADNPLSSVKNPLHSSLTCNKTNLVAGANENYKFADSVHPTPFTNLLLARYVSRSMEIKGWL